MSQQSNVRIRKTLGMGMNVFIDKTADFTHNTIPPLISSWKHKQLEHRCVVPTYTPTNQPIKVCSIKGFLSPPPPYLSQVKSDHP